MDNIIIGTAGHIDHGKTSLIKALTGFDGDSTNEEKRRGITIELSFSNISKDDKNIAFIDVPGHEKLVKNMIAGAFAFNAVLLVIDAKEGIMPQTKEHLEILNFFNTKFVIVALSKKDLVSQEMLKAQEESVKNTLKNYPNLSIFSIIATSIKDENSINELKNALFNVPSFQKTDSISRLYIDRVFHIKGQGSVVTGTLLDGNISKTDKLVVADLNKNVKIKSIQIHDNFYENATSFNRVALALNLEQKELQKGMLITKKGYLRGFDEVDVKLEIWDKNLNHNQNITALIGTKQVNGKILFLDDEFAKLKLDEQIFAVFNDKIIIQSSGKTTAGAIVLNPIKDPLKKKQKIQYLKALAKNDLKNAFKILINIHKKGFGLISSYQRFKLTHQEILSLLREIQDEVYLDELSLICYPKVTFFNFKAHILEIFKSNPNAMISPKTLVLKLKWVSENLAKTALDELRDENLLSFEKGIFTKKGENYESLSLKIENEIYNIIKTAKLAPEAPYNIYDFLDIDRKIGDDALKKLTASKKVIRLNHNLFIETTNLTKALEILREIIKTQGFVNIQNAKEKLNLSRKFIICYLEYLDKFDDIEKNENNRIFKH